jgi:tRNA modification GTPase
MTDTLETITARLTPAGSSALATIGICGPEALAIVRRLFHGRSDPVATLRTDRHYFGRFGRDLKDDVVVRVVQVEPRRVVEVHCHGGAAMVEVLLADIVSAGAVLVDWPDFLRRRGSSEIAVEAAQALARCETERAAAILVDQYRGALEAALARLERMGDPAVWARLLQLAPLGLHLVDPWKVLLFGRTNVGKSSLLNALAGFERVIVSPAPGTTRDVLRVRTAVGGWPVELIDGAGFREYADALEAQGQALLSQERAGVDLAILVMDTSEPVAPLDLSLRSAFSPDLVVGNKCDLPIHWPPQLLESLGLRCSATTGIGVPALAAAICARLVPIEPEPGEAVPFTRRQVALIERLLEPQLASGNRVPHNRLG